MNDWAETPKSFPKFSAVVPSSSEAFRQDACTCKQLAEKDNFPVSSPHATLPMHSSKDISYPPPPKQSHARSALPSRMARQLGVGSLGCFTTHAVSPKRTHQEPDLQKDMVCSETGANRGNGGNGGLGGEASLLCRGRGPSDILWRRGRAIHSALNAEVQAGGPAWFFFVWGLVLGVFHGLH